MKKGMNKKAQDLSIGTLILIVLGIIVLVLLILGFSMGWSNLWEKINIFGGGSSSIANIITTCNLAATQNDVYSFCQDFKQVKIDSKTTYVNCLDSRVEPSLDKKLTCNLPAENLTINKCLSLAVANKIDTNTQVNNIYCKASISCEDLAGVKKAKTETCPTGQTRKIEFQLKGTTTDQICCVPA